MLFETVETPGLAQRSYLIGSQGQAAVIDPRRDCEVYLELARKRGLEIRYVLETHRNEDLISGAPTLAEWTGARVLHGPNPAGPVAYAETVREGERLELGQLILEVLETPGHTDDHLAFALFDQDYPDGAVGVFTGDALFVGDVGRADFYPERREQVAGQLYDSLQKLLALGDQALIYPAHGAGSVCGSGMAERGFSSIGLERRNNPLLQLDREAFVARKLAETHYTPPYFQLMERLNLEGAPPPPRVLRPRTLRLGQLQGWDADHVLDVREPLAFLGGHFPGSLALPVDLLPAYAGWFVREGERVALVGDTEAQLHEAYTHLTRIGLDRVVGGVVDVVSAAAHGHACESLPTVDTARVEARLFRRDDDWTLLDVRTQHELAEGAIEGSQHLYLGHLPARWQELDPERAYTVLCASGKRATIAASFLAARGFGQVDVYVGSMGAWKSAHTPLSAAP